MIILLQRHLQGGASANTMLCRFKNDIEINISLLVLKRIGMKMQRNSFEVDINIIRLLRRNPFLSGLFLAFFPFLEEN